MMKTIIDAVNELKGDLGNLSLPISPLHISIIVMPGSSPYGYCATISEKRDLANSPCKFICSIPEFNAMVADMSEGFEEYKREYAGVKETVTVDGMAYEIGALYIGSSNELVRLDRVVNGEFIGVDTSNNRYQDSWLISIDQSSVFPKAKIGTITPAPVELIDGKAYMFEHRGSDYVGFYNKKTQGFVFSVVSSFVKASSATNIIPLVPEVK